LYARKRKDLQNFWQKKNLELAFHTLLGLEVFLWSPAVGGTTKACGKSRHRKKIQKKNGVNQ
jgi:hypothetical protein